MFSASSAELMRRLDAQRKKWVQKVRGFIAQIMQNERAPVNQDAVHMVGDIDNATEELQRGVAMDRRGNHPRVGDVTGGYGGTRVHPERRLSLSPVFPRFFVRCLILP